MRISSGVNNRRWASLCVYGSCEPGRNFTFLLARFAVRRFSKGKNISSRLFHRFELSKHPVECGFVDLSFDISLL